MDECDSGVVGSGVGLLDNGSVLTDCVVGIAVDSGIGIVGSTVVFGDLDVDFVGSAVVMLGRLC